jgi:arginase
VAPTLLGLPFDGFSSYRAGAADGPRAIRAALRSPSSNSFDEDLQDTGARLADAGDLTFLKACDPLPVIEAGVMEVLRGGGSPLMLGGDHSVTWPILRAFRTHRGAEPTSVLHLDAHPDLYDTFDGSRRSHACPFARVMEEGLADRLIQCGIRTLNAHQEEQARKFRVEIIPMRAGVEAMIQAAQATDGAVYVSVDLDVLDPAFAPGVSHPEPGGLSTRDLIRIIQALPRGRVIGADVVELNPAEDLRDLTARVAAKLVKEISGRMSD